MRKAVMETKIHVAAFESGFRDSLFSVSFVIVRWIDNKSPVFQRTKSNRECRFRWKLRYTYCG